MEENNNIESNQGISRIEDIDNHRVREAAESKFEEIREQMENPNKKPSIVRRKYTRKDDTEVWYYYANYHVPRDFDHEQYPEGREGTATEHIISVTDE